MSDGGEQRGLVRAAGARLLAGLAYAGGMTLLLGDAARWVGRSMVRRKVRFGRRALAEQMVRVGVRSSAIVLLVQLFMGVILALQMAPPLEQFQQQGQVPRIIGVAGFRMLGPIITAVVLSGFAGASIAAELGTMVVAEEIEAMEAMALNPVRFLVVPRVLASLLCLLLLTTFSDLMIAVGGYAVGLLIGPEVHAGYWERMRDGMDYSDYLTGLVQGGVFGLLIGLIACYEGLKVRGGASGVGRATTLTVVYSIVAIILAACVCTVIFYVYDI